MPPVGHCFLGPGPYNSPGVTCQLAWTTFSRCCSSSLIGLLLRSRLCFLISSLLFNWPTLYTLLDVFRRCPAPTHLGGSCCHSLDQQPDLYTLAVRLYWFLQLYRTADAILDFGGDLCAFWELWRRHSAEGFESKGLLPDWCGSKSKQGNRLGDVKLCLGYGKAGVTTRGIPHSFTGFRLLSQRPQQWNIWTKDGMFTLQVMNKKLAEYCQKCGGHWQQCCAQDTSWTWSSTSDSWTSPQSPRQRSSSARRRSRTKGTGQKADKGGKGHGGKGQEGKASPFDNTSYLSNQSSGTPWPMMDFEQFQQNQIPGSTAPVTQPTHQAAQDLVSALKKAFPEPSAMPSSFARHTRGRNRMGFGKSRKTYTQQRLHLVVLAKHTRKQASPGSFSSKDGWDTCKKA